MLVFHMYKPQSNLVQTSIYGAGPVTKKSAHSSVNLGVCKYENAAEGRGTKHCKQKRQVEEREMVSMCHEDKTFDPNDRETSLLQLLSLGLINLQMTKLKYKGCLRWEFCKNALMRFVEILQLGLSVTGVSSSTKVHSRCGCVETIEFANLKRHDTYSPASGRHKRDINCPKRKEMSRRQKNSQ